MRSICDRLSTGASVMHECSCGLASSLVFWTPFCTPYKWDKSFLWYIAWCWFHAFILGKFCPQFGILHLNQYRGFRFTKPCILTLNRALSFFFGLGDNSDGGTLNLGFLYLSGITLALSIGSSGHEYSTVEADPSLRDVSSIPSFISDPVWLYFGAGQWLKISLVILTLWSDLRSSLFSWIFASFLNGKTCGFELLTVIGEGLGVRDSSALAASSESTGARHQFDCEIQW